MARHTNVYQIQGLEIGKSQNIFLVSYISQKVNPKFTFESNVEFVIEILGMGATYGAYLGNT